MKRVVADCNQYDELLGDDKLRVDVTALVQAGRLQLLSDDVVREELAATSASVIESDSKGGRPPPVSSLSFSGSFGLKLLSSPS